VKWTADQRQTAAERETKLNEVLRLQGAGREERTADAKALRLEGPAQEEQTVEMKALRPQDMAR
jgi:hypothetical protein